MIKQGRLVSLDAFRGLTILLMIVVNNPGSWTYVYAPFRHSDWHGCTPTDLVFPFFLFIVGVAMYFSFSRLGNRFDTGVGLKILKRVVIIFLLGLLLNFFGKFEFAHLRIMGVLQRIALAYGAAAILVLIVKGAWRWLLGFGLLFAYWGLLWAFGDGAPYSLEGNIVGKIDLLILGKDHIYGGFGIPFDPEGLLSTIPAIVNVIFGFQVGEIIARGTHRKMVPLRLILIGAVGLVLGLAWGQLFPINKPIWTSSYVLYSSGIASILLAVFFWLIDIKGYVKWAHPLIVYGMNPLFIYLLNGIWVRSIIYLIHLPLEGESVSGYYWLYNAVFAPLAGNMAGSLLFALFHGVLFWFVGWLLYRKKIFIKI